MRLRHATHGSQSGLPAGSRRAREGPTSLAGFRTANGLELGAGPAVSANKDRAGLNTAMIVAAGATPPFGSVRLPVHFAISMAKGGPRFTTLIGWVVD